MGEQYYPDHLLPVIREREMPVGEELAAKYERFCQIREQILLDYGYNTARAYWGDLEDIALWAYERDKDPLDLSEKDVKQYMALLRRRKYSESTVRRRRTALRKLYDRAVQPNDSPGESRQVSRRVEVGRGH